MAENLNDAQADLRAAAKTLETVRTTLVPGAEAQQTPFLSIIIPCRNEIRFIANCLDSILSCDYGAEYLEILVADGRSDDGTRDVIQGFARRYSQIHLVDNVRRTTPAGLNAALRQARGAIIIRMDVHASYPPNYISQLVAWLDESCADNVGGVVETRPALPTSKCAAIASVLSSPFGVGNSHFRIGAAKPKWVDTVPFGCYRKEVFERIGNFDEALIRNQDDEFNLRLIRSGGRILLVPSIVSQYYARETLGKLWRMYFQYGWFKPLLYKKFGAAGTLRQLVPPVFVASLLLGGAFALPYRQLRPIFLALAGAYALSDLYFSLRLAAARGIRCMPWLMVAFPVLHFSYGLGYLAGIAHAFRSEAQRNSGDLPISR